MSVLVTGVPTRKRAKRKLKTREVEPRGATYSEGDVGCGSSCQGGEWTHQHACIRGPAYFL